MKQPRLAIVLVGAKGDANIGAVARAMKNFGLSDLRLVQCAPHLTEAARMWAASARDVLGAARTFPLLDDALADADLAVGFTRRLGKMRRCRMTVAELPAWMEERHRGSGAERSGGSAALVFGREDKGLSNDELGRCDAIVTIPSFAAMPSLNLAQAVLIAAYELFGHRRRTTRHGANGTRRPQRICSVTEGFVPRREAAALLKQFRATLEILEYDDTPASPLRAKILHRLERIFGRAGLTPRDVGMFGGLLARIASRAKDQAPSPAARKRSPSRSS